ncbi:MAG TPA: ROK family transcriptional regulator [Anaerolineaceae bacterium]|nr:ROK family transcriptional regulator [Anaerolineaceae bacterium]
MEKATRQFTKEYNSRLVLKTIYQAEDISRAEISRITGLTRTTVSDIVAGLIDEGLVEEVGIGASSGGKPPVQVSLVENARQIVCVDLSNPEFRGAVVNLRGSLQCSEVLPQQHQHGQANLAVVFELIEHLVSQATAPILGIAVGTPGLVNSQQGVVLRAVNLGWTDLPLKKDLQNRFQIPVYVSNDSHVAAMAEFTYGHWNKAPNLVVIKVGEGIGSGIVLDSKLYYGDGYSAGEIGHLSVVDEGGELCSCGKYGCLETVSSSQAVIREAQLLSAVKNGHALARDPQELTLERVSDWIASGDQDMAALVTRAGKYMGAVIASLIGILSIRKIIIAGDFGLFGDHYLDAVRCEAEKRVLPGMMANTEIAPSTLGANIVLLGVSALVMAEELGLP